MRATVSALPFTNRSNSSLSGPRRAGGGYLATMRSLGRGGMLRGVDVKLNCAVAIKVLAPQLAANATARGDTGASC